MSDKVQRATSHLLAGTTPAGSIDESTLNALQHWGVEGIIPLEAEPMLFTTDSVLRRAQAMNLLTTAERQRIISLATSTLGTLDEHGVIATPFKGLSTERYYPSGIHRWYGDADLYIADPSAGDLVGALIALGLTPDGAHNIVTLARKRRLDGVAVLEDIGLDIHFIPTGQFFQATAFAPEFLTIEHLGSTPEARAPRPEFDLMIAAVNSVRDAGRSFKAAVDVVHILRATHEQIDWTVFDRLVEHFDMQNVARPAIATIERDLDVPLQHLLDRSTLPIDRLRLDASSTFWTRKRSKLLNLYFGPNRGQAAMAAMRWVAPSRARMHAEGNATVDASHLRRTNLWRNRLRRLRQ